MRHSYRLDPPQNFPASVEPSGASSLPKPPFPSPGVLPGPQQPGEQIFVLLGAQVPPLPVRRRHLRLRFSLVGLDDAGRAKQGELRAGAARWSQNAALPPKTGFTPPPPPHPAARGESALARDSDGCALSRQIRNISGT